MDISNNAGSYNGDQKIGSVTVRMGRRPQVSNVVNALGSSISGDGDYFGDNIVALAEITGLYENRFILPSGGDTYYIGGGSSSGFTSFGNVSLTGNIIPNVSGAYIIGTGDYPLKSLNVNDLAIGSGSIANAQGAAPYQMRLKDGIITSNYFSYTNPIYGVHPTRPNGVGASTADSTSILANGLIVATFGDSAGQALTLTNGVGSIYPRLDFRPGGGVGYTLAMASMNSLDYYNYTTSGMRLNIFNFRTSNNVCEALSIGYLDQVKASIKVISSGTGLFRPLALEAGSGVGLTQLTLTTSGMLNLNTAYQTAAAAASTHKIPIVVSGQQMYLLATTA